VALITQHFLNSKSATISAEAMQQLSEYAWPGNVRELQNILERAAILAGGQPITLQHLPADISSHAHSTQATSAAPMQEFVYSIPKAVEQIERKLIMDAIAACSGNKSKAAKLLEISERSLWYKLEQYQLK
jgi:two-component system response regulator AtoC